MVTKNPTPKKEVRAPLEETQEALRAACQAHALAHMVYGQISAAHPWAAIGTHPYAVHPSVMPGPQPWASAWEPAAPASPAPVGPMPYPFPFAGYPR